MREIIKKLKVIEKEQLRRRNNPLKNYNKTKVHQKQMAFHKCLKKNRWVFGGNRSGKSQCGAVETVWLARGIHPFRKNKSDISCWVVSLSQQVQRDVAQQKILTYLDKSWIEKVVMLSGSRGAFEHGIIDYIVIKNVFGGTSKIGFKSCEAGREKFAGASLDFVWFDEEPPFEIYQECQMRVLDRSGHIFGTMTPLKGQTWVYDEIYMNKNDSDEVWYEFMEWGDNPYLDKNEIDYLCKSMSQESLNSRRFGQFSRANGLVYSEFDENLHVIEPFDVPAEWQDCLSIDPGLNNPLSCHWYCVDGDGTVYVVYEHYLAGQDVNYHCEKIKEICKKLNWHTDRFGRIKAYIDSAANQRTLSGLKNVAELFLENGIGVVTTVNKDLFYGINKVKSYLRPINEPPRLYIFSNCKNLIRELKGYVWSQGEKPIKADDHALDELRYYLCTRPEPYVAKEQKSYIQLDKEKLYRRLKQRR